MLKAIEAITYPLAFANFRNEFYGHKAVKLQGDINRFSIDFSWDSLNNLLNTRKVPFSKIKLFSRGQPLAEPRDHFSILRHCTNGGDMVIHDIELHDLNIREFSHNLADQLKSQVHVSLYIDSPVKNNQNYISQFYHSFVIQLEGRKNWTVSSVTGPAQQPVPYLECSLDPGDVLYIPAKHFPRPENVSPSLSLVMTIKQPTGTDFLTWLINNELIKDDLFRKPLPLEFLDDQDEHSLSHSWQDRLTELTDLFHKKLEDESLMERYYEFTVKTQQGIINYTFPLPFIAEPVQDLKNIKLFRAENQDSIIKENTPKKIIDIFFWNQQFSFPEKFKPLINYIFSQTVFAGSDLLQLTDNLTEEEITGWVNNLIKRGILKFQLSGPEL